MVSVAHLMSYRRPIGLGFDGPTWSGLLAAVDGDLSVSWVRAARARPDRMGWATSADLPPLERRATFVRRASLYRGREIAALGFGYVGTRYDASPGGPTDDRSVWAPLWVPWAAVAAAVALLWRRWSRLRGRSAANLCLRCGYDLRASPSRCPECGDAVGKPAPAPAAPAAAAAR